MAGLYRATAPRSVTITAVQSTEGQNHHLEQLKQWRNRPERDLSMTFVNDLFKRQIERPHKQVRAVVVLWEQLLPPKLLEHCRLESLRGGVLRVAVDSSERLYELDRRLRGGLEQELIRALPATAVRRIQLRVGKV